MDEFDISMLESMENKPFDLTITRHYSDIRDAYVLSARLYVPVHGKVSNGAHTVNCLTLHGERVSLLLECLLNIPPVISVDTLQKVFTTQEMKDFRASFPSSVV